MQKNTNLIITLLLLRFNKLMHTCVLRFCETDCYRQINFASTRVENKHLFIHNRIYVYTGAKNIYVLYYHFTSITYDNTFDEHDGPVSSVTRSLHNANTETEEGPRYLSLIINLR